MVTPERSALGPGPEKIGLDYSPRKCFLRILKMYVCAHKGLIRWYMAKIIICRPPCPGLMHYQILEDRVQSNGFSGTGPMLLGLVLWSAAHFVHNLPRKICFKSPFLFHFTISQLLSKKTLNSIVSCPIIMCVMEDNFHVLMNRSWYNAKSRLEKTVLFWSH